MSCKSSSSFDNTSPILTYLISNGISQGQLKNYKTASELENSNSCHMLIKLSRVAVFAFLPEH